ncbi:hypothetical protein [Zobellia nedashkovskayae]|uniref:hypothetical protein n=1 Tax=Zobellia nedashkovskayae TaxID=2779510 RepID=UPI00188A84D8|nr:hypothetical protein [Zobellia nedashkovskayae]
MKNKNVNPKELQFEKKSLVELDSLEKVNVEGGDISNALGAISDRLKEIEKYRYTQK